MLDYQLNKGLNFSTMKHYLRSPLHYRHAVDNPAGDTDAFVFGRAFHCHLLERERFKAEFWILDESRRPNPEKNFTDGKNKAWKKERREENAGSLMLTSSEYTQILGMTESLKRSGAVRKLVTACQKEAELYWNDPDTGVACKARVDMYEPKTGTVLDIKTCQDASYTGFRSSLFKYDYYLQMAHYAGGLKARFLKDFDRQIIIAVEKEPPYAFGIYQLDEVTRNFSRAVASKLYTLHAECTAKNEWPGYESVADSPQGITEMSLTDYQMGAIENLRIIQNL